MAIDQGTETIAIKTQERTWRINIETPLGGDPVITSYRETVRTGPDGAVISREASVDTSRALSDVAAQAFKVGGNSYTTIEIAAVVAAIADTWRQEDIAAEAARLAGGQKAEKPAA
jgi:hypothetical protein